MASKLKVRITFTENMKKVVKVFEGPIDTVLIDGVSESLIHFRKGRRLMLAIPSSAFISLVADAEEGKLRLVS